MRLSLLNIVGNLNFLKTAGIIREYVDVIAESIQEKCKFLSFFLENSLMNCFSEKL